VQHVTSVQEISYACNCRPSVLWHCWLGGKKGIRPIKNWGMVEVVIG